jgi:hypothetical protein
MRLYNINGRLVNKNVSKYLIDWETKSRSQLQFRAKLFLKKFWSNHLVFEEFPVFGSRMKVDFVNITKKISIEINGEQHENFNPFFHNNSRLNFKESIKRDYKKLEWLERNGFTAIEIVEKEVDKLSVSFFKEKFGVDII